jgi:elongation factor G
MHANKREDTDDISAGEIAAVVGLKHSVTGDTISDKDHPILLESMNFPEPVISVAIEPKTKVDQDKLGDALSKLTFEDPTFKVKQDDETGQTIISGMGELHLEILVDRMLREFKIEANVGKPQVAYRETITEAVRSEGKFIRQSGGRGQYGHVILEIEPLDTQESFAFENCVVGGDIPKEFISPIKAGLQEALENGVIAGYPMVGIGVRLMSGTFHEVDSSEIAFKAAASIALRDGVKKAGAALLEPIMDVEVVVPEQYLGDVIGDLKAHRGNIEGIAPRADGQIVAATVPLGEMFGYATRLRSITQGRAIYTMQFGKYNQVPEALMKILVTGAVA